MSIKIIIADDHQMFIDGIKSLLKDEPDIEVVGEALNGYQVLDVISSTPADVVLMDINMPKLDGLEATRLITQKYPDTSVVILTMHNSLVYIESLTEAGASGYILKDTGKQELLMAIRSAASGGKFFSQNVMVTLLEQSAKNKTKDSQPKEPHLSKREIEVLKLIVQEYTTQEIADKLFISNHTVETHRKNLLDKLNARNIAGLVKYAIQNQII
jgi:DNA-binding NarL/FixJ family response regulator